MDIRGLWRNQNGSILAIDSVDDGRFTGTFVSTKGRAAQDRSYTVHGLINGEVLAFAVDFRNEEANLGSISNFTGRLDGDTMHTVWVLARQFEDAGRTKPTQPWNAFLVNADRFTRER